MVGAAAATLEWLPEDSAIFLMANDHHGSVRFYSNMEREDLLSFLQQALDNLINNKDVKY